MPLIDWSRNYQVSKYADIDFNTILGLPEGGLKVPNNGKGVIFDIDTIGGGILNGDLKIGSFGGAYLNPELNLSYDYGLKLDLGRAGIAVNGGASISIEGDINDQNELDLELDIDIQPFKLNWNFTSPSLAAWAYLYYNAGIDVDYFWDIPAPKWLKSWINIPWSGRGDLIHPRASGRLGDEIGFKGSTFSGELTFFDGLNTNIGTRLLGEQALKASNTKAARLEPSYTKRLLKYIDMSFYSPTVPKPSLKKDGVGLNAKFPILEVTGDLDRAIADFTGFPITFEEEISLFDVAYAGFDWSLVNIDPTIQVDGFYNLDLQVDPPDRLYIYSWESGSQSTDPIAVLSGKSFGEGKDDLLKAINGLNDNNKNGKYDLSIRWKPVAKIVGDAGVNSSFFIKTSALEANAKLGIDVTLGVGSFKKRFKDEWRVGVGPLIPERNIPVFDETTYLVKKGSERSISLPEINIPISFTRAGLDPAIFDTSLFDSDLYQLPAAVKKLEVGFKKSMVELDSAFQDGLKITSNELTAANLGLRLPNVSENTQRNYNIFADAGGGDNQFNLVSVNEKIEYSKNNEAAENTFQYKGKVSHLSLSKTQVMDLAQLAIACYERTWKSEESNQYLLTDEWEPITDKLNIKVDNDNGVTLKSGKKIFSTIDNGYRYAAADKKLNSSNPGLNQPDANVVIFENEKGDITIAFTGTEFYREDTDEYFNAFGGITDQYERFEPVYEALDQYLISKKKPVNVFVTGHSLGGALTERYMKEHQDGAINNVIYRAVTLATAETRDGEDIRTLNIGFDNDTVYSIGGNKGPNCTDGLYFNLDGQKGFDYKFGSHSKWGHLYAIGTLQASSFYDKTTLNSLYIGEEQNINQVVFSVGDSEKFHDDWFIERHELVKDNYKISEAQEKLLNEDRMLILGRGGVFANKDGAIAQMQKNQRTSIDWSAVQKAGGLDIAVIKKLQEDHEAREADKLENILLEIDDSLHGRAGKIDYIEAFHGDDIIYGEIKTGTSDVLSGGHGSDTFVIYPENATGDTIVDLEIGDKIAIFDAIVEDKASITANASGIQLKAKRANFLGLTSTTFTVNIKATLPANAGIRLSKDRFNDGGHLLEIISLPLLLGPREKTSEAIEDVNASIDTQTVAEAKPQSLSISSPIKQLNTLENVNKTIETPGLGIVSYQDSDSANTSFNAQSSFQIETTNAPGKLSHFGYYYDDGQLYSLEEIFSDTRFVPQYFQQVYGAIVDLKDNDDTYTGVAGQSVVAMGNGDDHVTVMSPFDLYNDERSIEGVRVNRRGWIEFLEDNFKGLMHPNSLSIRRHSQHWALPHAFYDLGQGSDNYTETSPSMLTHREITTYLENNSIDKLTIIVEGESSVIVAGVSDSSGQQDYVLLNEDHVFINKDSVHRVAEIQYQEPDQEIKDLEDTIYGNTPRAKSRHLINLDYSLLNGVGGVELVIESEDRDNYKGNEPYSVDPWYSGSSAFDPDYYRVEGENIYDVRITGSNQSDRFTINTSVDNVDGLNGQDTYILNASFLPTINAAGEWGYDGGIQRNPWSFILDKQGDSTIIIKPEALASFYSFGAFTFNTNNYEELRERAHRMDLDVGEDDANVNTIDFDVIPRSDLPTWKLDLSEITDFDSRKVYSSSDLIDQFGGKLTQFVDSPMEIVLGKGDNYFDPAEIWGGNLPATFEKEQFRPTNSLFNDFTTIYQLGSGHDTLFGYAKSDIYIYEEGIKLITDEDALDDDALIINRPIENVRLSKDGDFNLITFTDSETDQIKLKNIENISIQYTEKDDYLFHFKTIADEVFTQPPLLFRGIPEVYFDGSIPADLFDIYLTVPTDRTNDRSQFGLNEDGSLTISKTLIASKITTLSPTLAKTVSLNTQGEFKVFELENNAYVIEKSNQFEKSESLSYALRVGDREFMGKITFNFVNASAIGDRIYLADEQGEFKSEDGTTSLKATVGNGGLLTTGSVVELRDTDGDGRINGNEFGLDIDEDGVIDPLPATDTLTSGLISFSVEIQAEAESEETIVDLNLVNEIEANNYRKHVGGEWIDFLYDSSRPNAGGAELIDRNQNGLIDHIKLHLFDGGAGDADGIKNGIIEDPGILTITTSEGPSIYRFYNSQSGTHFYTPSTEEANNVIKQSVGDLFTIENALGQAPTSNGWGYQFEGIAYKAPPQEAPQVTNLYRFYNKAKGYHFMTKDDKEAQNILNNSVGSGFDLLTGQGQTPIEGGWGYQYEGRSYAISSEPQSFANTEVYRFFHNERGVHFFTASLDEALHVVSNSTGLDLIDDINQALNVQPTSNGWGYTYEGIAWYVQP